METGWKQVGNRLETGWKQVGNRLEMVFLLRALKGVSIKLALRIIFNLKAIPVCLENPYTKFIQFLSHFFYETIIISEKKRRKG